MRAPRLPLRPIAKALLAVAAVPVLIVIFFASFSENRR